MRARIAALRVEIPTPDGPLTVTGLTASIGAAIHPGHGDDLTALMHAADAALYAAKRAGRNTVRLAALPPSEALTSTRSTRLTRSRRSGERFGSATRPGQYHRR